MARTRNYAFPPSFPFPRLKAPLEALVALGDMNQEARLVRDLDLALRKKSRKEARGKWKKAMVGKDDGKHEKGCIADAEERCCAVAVGKCDVWPGACRVCRNTMPVTSTTTCDACQHRLFPKHMLVLKPVSDKVKVCLEQRIKDMSETIEALKESSRTAHEKAHKDTQGVHLRHEKAHKEIVLKMDAIMKRLDEKSGGEQSQGSTAPHKGEPD